MGSPDRLMFPLMLHPTARNPNSTTTAPPTTAAITMKAASAERFFRASRLFQAAWGRRLCLTETGDDIGGERGIINGEDEGLSIHPATENLDSVAEELNRDDTSQ